MTIEIARARIRCAMAQRDLLLMAQDKKITWGIFVELYMKEFKNKEHIDPNAYVKEYSRDWVEKEETNELTNFSSGSTYTAIISFDNNFHDYDTNDKPLWDQIYKEHNAIDWYAPVF